MREVIGERSPGSGYGEKVKDIAASAVCTPCGQFGILACSDGVLAAGFADHPEQLIPLIYPALHDIRLRYSSTHPAAVAIQDYFDGDLLAPATLPVIQSASSFTKSVWHALLSIPPGNTMSYSSIARLCSIPNAYRAVGNACARNPAALFIPCHRVVPSSGTVGRYAYGEERKSWLLRHEGALLAKSSIWHA
jgi:methylated-DNA-[protein]-cysteine S-methyltransferase